MTVPAHFTDNNLKEIYANFITDLIPYHQGPLSQITKYGQQPQELLSGGQWFTMLLDLGIGGAIGYPDGTSSRKLTHFGNEVPDRKKLKVRTTYGYERSTINATRIEMWRQGQNRGQFIQDTLHNLRRMEEFGWKQLEALFMSAGDGSYFTTLDDTGSSIAAGDPGTMHVANVQFLTVEQTVQLFDGASTYVGPITITAVPGGTGSGSVSIRNDSANSITPTSGHYVVPCYGPSLDQHFVSSLDEAVGIATYPRAICTETSLDNALYKSVVLDGLSGSAPQTISYSMLHALSDPIRGQLPIEYVQQVKDERTTYLTYPCAWVMGYGHINAIMEELAKKERFVNLVQEKDYGWGSTLTIDNVPCVPTHLIKSNTVYLVHARGFCSTMNPPRPITTGEAGVFRLMSGSDIYEALYIWSMGIYAAQRNIQGKITNVKGVDYTDAGLTRTTS